MRDTQAVLQEVFNAISTGIFVIDVEWVDDREPAATDFRFATINPAYAQMLSLSTTAMVGLRPHQCLPPDIADRFCANYSYCLKERQAIRYEESFKLGVAPCTVLTTLSPQFEPDGRISRLIGSSQDITQIRQVEAALSQEKELLSTLIKNAPIGIVSTDEFGKILFINPAFARICGYSPEELVGQTPPYPYWDLADLDRINEEFRLAMSGEKKQIELWFTRKNGERFLARLQPITIFDERGTMLRHLATMEDITQYKQAEEELHKALETERELNELKSRFIATVSHEYRTPLTTILSSAELLERYADQFTEENKLKHYRRIQRTASLLSQLVNDILTMSKIEAGKQEFNPSWLDLEKFCSELVEELQLTIASQHHLVFTSHGCVKLTGQEPSSIAPAAYMDEKLFRYIIGNLLSNAIKYSPQGSTVKFDLVYQQNQVILKIQDEGIGIPLEDQQYLFESFHRGSNVGTTSGTGLGLAIVKQAVDLHHGQMVVASKVGVGTTFTITLPSSH